MSNDLDIDRLPYQDAEQYVLSFVTTLKGIEGELKNLGGELELWRRRARLAEDNHKAELIPIARQKISELQGKSSQLELERKSLKLKVSILIEKLNSIKNQPAGAVNTDELLQKMKMLVGEQDKTNELIEDLEAQQALEELKKHLQEENQ
jgi:predicted transcriptional regulator